MQSDLFSGEQSPALADAAPRDRPRRKIKHHGVEVEVDSTDDGRPNLNTLDTRIYGLQIPITICRADCRLIHLSDQEADEWKRKYLPLKCVYAEADFTPEGQVAILRQRGYPFWGIARDFPELADAAVAVAIAAGHAIG